MKLESKKNAQQYQHASNHHLIHEVLNFSRLNRIILSFFMLLLILAVFDTAKAQTNEVQSLDAIRNNVKLFLQQQLVSVNYNDVTINVKQLDSRLKLSRCDEPLEAFLPTNQVLIGNVSVGIRCQSQKRWSIYVPAKVEIYEDVIAAARPLLRGHKLGTSDLVTVRKKINKRDKQFFRSKADVINLIVKRNIPAGKILLPQIVQAPRLVQRGTEVILIAETNALSVRMSGRALADGAKGELIQVRNNSSNRIVEGIVTKQGTVEVKM